MINDRFSRFESYDFLELASKIKDWGEVDETPPKYKESKDTQTESETPPVHTPPVFNRKSITISTLKPRYSKTFLESQTDVEEYVQAFKAALLAELEKGNSLLVN